MIPYLDLGKQYNALKDDINARVLKVLENTKYILGPEVAESEQALAEFTGAKHCITAASGTDALVMGLLAKGVKPGDEVIVPSFSFFATAEVVALLGATPVFVDVEEDTYNIDVSQIEAVITDKTKMIIPVSLYGQMPDMNELMALGQKHNISIMEDAAQSFGALYDGKRSCSIADMSATSFFPAKPLGCAGDGGAIFTNDDDLAQLLKEVRVHGMRTRYNHTSLGINGRMDAVQCAVILAKLPRYAWEMEQRQKIAYTYDQAFAGLEKVTTPTIRDGRNSVYAQYTLAVDGRDQFCEFLKEKGVPTAVHYPKGMHQQPVFKDMEVPSLPVTESVCEKVVSLPLYADMPEEHIEQVIAAVKSY